MAAQETVDKHQEVASFMIQQNIGPGHTGRHGRWRPLLLLLVVFMMMITGSAFPEHCSGAGVKLLDPEQLNRESQEWVILDARPEALWEKAHIPGAVCFSWESHTYTDARKIPYRVQDPDILAQALGSIGIRADTPIAVYGDADASWGGEGWVCWVLKWLGHPGDIALVNGGIQAWTARGFALARGREAQVPEAVTYRAQPVSAMMVSAEALAAKAGTFHAVDTRSTLEWLRGGRLPGAVHLPWEKFFTGRNRQPLNRESLMDLFARHKLTLDRPVVYYCTGGIRSAYAWMVHELAGLPGAVNFEGGTEEWKVFLP